MSDSDAPKDSKAVDSDAGKKDPNKPAAAASGPQGGKDKRKPAASGTKKQGAGSKDDKPRKQGRGAWLLALLALLIALAAGIAAGWLWYRGEQRLAELSSRVNTVEHGLQSDVQDMLLPQIKKLKTRQQSLANAGGQRDQTISQLQHGLDRSRVQLSELTDKVEGGHRRWQLLEVESLLVAANERLQLSHSPEDAEQALKLASQRLGQLNDPRLFKVREQVVNEIAALNALPRPDIQGLSLQLSSLLKQVPRLKLAAHVPSDYPGPGVADDDQGLPERPWKHFLDSIRQALDAMVTIRRTDGEHQPLLPPRQAFFLYQNLQLKLQTARLALLQGRSDTYSDALTTAQQWLKTFFDNSDSAVAGAIRQLESMRKEQLSWQAPDISDSLTMLRSFMRKHSQGEGQRGGAQAHAGKSQADNKAAGDEAAADSSSKDGE